MLRKPALRFIQLDRRQVAELEGLLGNDLTVLADADLSDVLKGWQLLECSGKPARPAGWQDTLRWKHGLAWLSVKPCAEEKHVASFFLRLVEARVPVHLVELEQRIAEVDGCCS